MHTLRTVPLSHDGKEYEIRVMGEGNTVYVQAFLENRRANGFSYQVSIDDVAFNFLNIAGLAAIDELVEMAKRDVIEHRWEDVLRLAGACQQL